MTNTELIRQEIERLKAELPPQDLYTTVGADSICIANKYDEILSFIDSLPEEEHERLPNINCVWYKGGECKKGLPGTKCDVVGCVAYISKAESILIDKRGKRVV